MPINAGYEYFNAEKEYLNAQTLADKIYWLEEMITAKRINRFRRSDGWVTVGVDPVRGTKPGFSYPGPERRRSVSPGPIRSAA